MLDKIKVVEEASDEFRQAVEWYESKTKGQGLRFADEIEITFERIKLNPDLYQKVKDTIRKIQVNKYPYSVFYKINTDTLVILRIFHNKRKPLTNRELN